MAIHTQVSPFDELCRAVESLVAQIQVLVTAVDDLRCEVEWQARNQAAAGTELAWTASSELASTVDNRPFSARIISNNLHAPPGSPTATAELAALETHLTRCPRRVWQEEWDDRDDVELPSGYALSVEPKLWHEVLHIRPAHIIGEDCCCEAGEGAPYLLAWLTEDEFFLRELDDDSARRLQTLCLAAHQPVQQPAEVASVAATQLDLF